MTDDSINQVQQLLDGLSARDDEARARLLVYVRGRWEGFARRALHGSWRRLEAFEQTDDLLSELSARVLQEWKEGAGPKTAAEFLSHVGQQFGRMLVELARKHGGRNYNRPTTVPLSPPAEDSDAPAGNDPSEDTLDPVRLAYWAEFHRQVEALPEAQRNVFALRWYHDLTVAETAAALGISERLVSDRLRLARLRLQEALKDNPFGAA